MEAPVESFAKSNRLITPQPSPSLALAFDTDKQKNAQFLNKGLTKPGRISFDVLRRAVQSTHIARICVDVLKKKVTKTKWIIKPIDQAKKVTPEQQVRIDKVTGLFKHPNQNGETFRTFLDKLVEDILVVDVGVIEKTRYEDGSLAELWHVDSTTIRPVFDEFGRQDVDITMLANAGSEYSGGQITLPVSYVQILNASQYGGPESGEIIAAWQKKDMIRFMANPQGTMEGFGYGLSPIEAVVTVVSNILNADNYNATYFEEGSFPPVIIQILGQVNQRDVQQYREYLLQELSGRYHRPAIMAGGNEAKILNLKDLTNRDMEFMEYMKFMARLMAAAFGLSGQDIGLTEEVGSKNVSETQKDLSNEKGYSSLLTLLEEIFNQEVIWKDFGYDDLEFEWVNDDTTDPKDAADIHTKHLQAGMITLNEARQQTGKQPYGAWADVPMVLTATGYVPVVQAPEEEGQDEEEGEEGKTKDTPESDGKEEPRDKQSEENKGTEDVGGEKPYEQQSNPTKKSIASRIVNLVRNRKLTKTTNLLKDIPVIFGTMITDLALRQRTAEMFRNNEARGFSEMGYHYNFESAYKELANYIEHNPYAYGGITKIPKLDGMIMYTVKVKNNANSK
jgi:capsid portal protein